MQQSAQCIGLHDANLHQLSTYTMYCQNRLLSLALGGDETCLWLSGGGANCPRVGRIGFVPQYKRAARIGQILTLPHSQGLAVVAPSRGR